MNNNIIKSKKNELSSVIRDALVTSLPPLFKVHRELLNKANPRGKKLECSTQELTRFTGYNSNEVETILKDLSMLNFIEYNKENKKWKIKVLVY